MQRRTKIHLGENRTRFIYYDDSERSEMIECI